MKNKHVKSILIAVAAVLLSPLFGLIFITNNSILASLENSGIILHIVRLIINTFISAAAFSSSAIIINQLIYKKYKKKSQSSLMSTVFFAAGAVDAIIGTVIHLLLSLIGQMPELVFKTINFINGYVVSFIIFYIFANVIDKYFTEKEGNEKKSLNIVKPMKYIGLLILVIGIILFIYDVAEGPQNTVINSYENIRGDTILYLAEESATGMYIIGIVMTIIGGIMFGIGKANE